MKTLYDEIRSPERIRNWRSLIAPLCCVAAPVLGQVLFLLLRGNKALMNGWVNYVTTPIKRGISFLCEPFPVAVAEAVIVVAVLVFLAFLARTIYLLIVRKDRLLRLLRRTLALVSAVCFIYLGYTLMWGANYYADTFSDKSGIETRGVTVEELAVLNASFVQHLNQYANQVSRDEDGVFDENLESVFLSTDTAYDGIIEEFPFLAAPHRTPKALISSPLVSRLDFTGFFFPFTGESLINDDCPSCLIPATLLHEMAHQRNIAGEDECNFVAIIAGLRSGDPVFNYSSALMGYIHLGNALYSVDPNTYWSIRSNLDPLVEADLEANNLYWNSFTSPLEHTVEKVSNTVYENFLQSYGQVNGLKTYGQCVDLLAAYYFDHQWAD